MEDAFLMRRGQSQLAIDSSCKYLIQIVTKHDLCRPCPANDSTKL